MRDPREEGGAGQSSNGTPQPIDTNNNDDNNNTNTNSSDPGPDGTTATESRTDPVQGGGSDGSSGSGSRTDGGAAGGQAPSQPMTQQQQQHLKHLPSQKSLALWTEVANGIDKNQTVVWQNAVDSLSEAHRCLHYAKEARSFTDQYMKPVISILLEQHPQKIGQMERGCVEESLTLATKIAVDDLVYHVKHLDKDTDTNTGGDSTTTTTTTAENQTKEPGNCNFTLEVLGLVFNRKKQFYKGCKQGWNSHLNGLPEARIAMITKFRVMKGFATLGAYLSKRVGTKDFPPLETLHFLLSAAAEPMSRQMNDSIHLQAAKKATDNDNLSVTKAVMAHISNATEDELKAMHRDSNEMLNTLRLDMQLIFEKLATKQWTEMYGFHDFCRTFAYKLITSQSLPLKLFGWDTVSDLITAAEDNCPCPMAFMVSGAGSTFANGRYEYKGELTEEGFSRRGGDIKYELNVPEGSVEPDSKAKTLTLFRCTMRSQQKWWFLSEADEDQPGTDKDIDYYQHKSKPHEEREPPQSGWLTCRNAGVDPPPDLSPIGLMVPTGEETNTLEHQLAKWALTNGVIEIVLGSSIHREIVVRSTPLIKFLASMCTRDEDEPADQMETDSNQYCLQASHLKLAWKTCTSKLDSAVSAEVYALLVQILPSLPKELAVQLIQSIQQSLQENSNGQHYLFEVAEFCSALSNPSLSETNCGVISSLTTEVRAEVLKLLWELLTHPNAETLKSYESIKAFVIREISAENISQREMFLESCKTALRHHLSLGTTEEALALRMVNLTRFILEASSREEAISMVEAKNNQLTLLVFEELSMYIKRRCSPQTLVKKPSSVNNNNDCNHRIALTERLNVIRYIYGLSGKVSMTTQQLDLLWRLCCIPEDRESVMVFLANASINQPGSQSNVHGDGVVGPAPADSTSRLRQPLTAAYSDEVRVYAFKSLFCSEDVHWEKVGESAYDSFQILFKSLKKLGMTNVTFSEQALNALWRICLNAGNNEVASQAMKDLLVQYSAISAVKRQNMVPNAWNAKSKKEEVQAIPDEDFSYRILGFFKDIKKGLKAGNPSSVRSLERSIRILNAAVGHNTGSNKKNSSAATVDALLTSSSLMDIVHSVPHGYRGTTCYRMINVMVKRPNSQNNANYGRNGQRLPHTERFSLQIHPLETLCAIRHKVALHCRHQHNLVKAISMSGSRHLNNEPDDAIAMDIPINGGCELIFLLSSNPINENKAARNIEPFEQKSGLELGMIFGGDGGGPSDQFFDTLLDVLEALPSNENEYEFKYETSKLVWDLLLAVPSNRGVVENVRTTAQRSLSNETYQHDIERRKKSESPMSIDTKTKHEEWQKLIDFSNFEKSVYVLQVIDSFLLPSVEVLQHTDSQIQKQLAKGLEQDASFFRTGFIESGGFNAVLRFFNSSGSGSLTKSRRLQMGNQYALRIFKCCFFGNSGLSTAFDDSTPLPVPSLDDSGEVLMSSLEEDEALMKSLISMVIHDDAVTDTVIFDVVILLRCLLVSEQRTLMFASLPDMMPETFIMKLLLWDSQSTMTSNVNALRIRKTIEELILYTPDLGKIALPWLVKALESIKVSSETCSEFFSVLVRMVDDTAQHSSLTALHLKDLVQGVCMKLANLPRSSSDGSDSSLSGVLCGCLKILKVLIQNGAFVSLKQGASLLMKNHNLKSWVEEASISSEDLPFISLMTAIFDGFLVTGSSSEDAICSDEKSRQLGFEVVATCAKACKSGEGYVLLCNRISDIINSASPSLRHKWGHNVGIEDRERGMNRSLANSKYSGLRNQGCTCYMNSVLQQLFMMPELRKSICSATLPSSLRSSGSCLMKKGEELVGKRLKVSWDNGSSHEAMVLAYDKATDMHTIRYCLPNISNLGGNYANRINPDDIARLSEDIEEALVLSEGRPGKETGHYEVVEPEGPQLESNQRSPSEKESNMGNVDSTQTETAIKEAEDEGSYRKVLEEVQRTFVYLDKGARGKVFDPRVLVEASGCLKLEFDIWQQNDASEYAMKLLDRLEVPLKRWSHSHFKHLEQTFRLKQTKQKICKECGLTTNREENLMNIDCQIRGKADIYEALATMCEAEYMEGDNKVHCENCKRKTDTILRTSISFLPDVLILSLKRFDLDYNTFETVKLNSRCAFDQTLNMKKYTLEGVEAMEKATSQSKDSSDMDTEEHVDPLCSLPDEDYEYKLAGVLVHHGYAQGGHYYSFIRDRSVGQDESQNKWYRFDDEVVTPFDPSAIEAECFGGKVKKETKWPNGQVNTVESDQLANALMLFYEKVKPVKSSEEIQEDCPMEESEESEGKAVPMTNGYEVFQADVKQSNTTHRSHTFLFDPEFQSFLKDMLNACQSSGNSNGSDSMDIDSNGQQSVLLELSLSFFFNILLHAVEKDTLDEWTESLSQVLLASPKVAKLFVHDLARKTGKVSENWLKIYTTDCPQDSSRLAAMKVIGTALRSCLTYPEELQLLESWTQAWSDQLLSMNAEKLNVRLPACLDAKWSYLESIELIDNGKASSIGIIISLLNRLLDVAPRTWRYNGELCVLLTEMGSIPSEQGGHILRNAMVQAQIHSRLICLINREKSPQLLRYAFPDASMLPEVAEALARSETSLAVLPQGNNGVGLGQNTASLPSHADNLNALEALASIIGVPGAKGAALVDETGELIKGRAVFDLTREAVSALTVVFKEFTNSTGLMGHQDILHYLESCGVDTHTMSQQRIGHILNKYGKDSNQLSLEGFLAYYRDTSQSNDSQIRSDLFACGFRPDLSRSPDESRYCIMGEQQMVYDKMESVAIDVAMAKQLGKLPELGPFAESGLGSISLHLNAYAISAHLAEYLLAFSACEKNSSRLLIDSLRYLQRAPPSWAGNEAAGACTMIFKILAALPDDMQDQRISGLLLSSEQLVSNSDVGAGLFHVTKEYSVARNNPHYNVDYHNLFDRYVEILKELQKVTKVTEWMKKHQNEWMFLEQYLRSDMNMSQQIPGVQLTPDHHLPSDSEPNGELNYSEEDDDDSRFDNTEAFTPGVVEVSNAGVACVNGIYYANGSCDNVAKYVKEASWNGKECSFSLFRCRLSDHSRRWYISIVPESIEPGTNKDIDFYLSQATGVHNEVPGNVWLTAKSDSGKGIDPPPSVHHKQEPVISDDDPIDSNERMSGAENLSIDGFSGNDENMSYH